MFISSVALKRAEILGMVCDCPGNLPKSALKFLNKFEGCKLQTDQAREDIIEWVRSGKYDRLRHYKALTPGLLYLFDEFPMLTGARWTHSISPTYVDAREIRILIKDVLKMGEALGRSRNLEKHLSNFSSTADIQEFQSTDRENVT